MMAARVSADVDDAPHSSPLNTIHDSDTEGNTSSAAACSDRCMTTFGWAFDVFLIVVNLTDVVSDCLIAAQFYRAGHTTFFWLVVASLILASIIYTIVGVEFLLREKLHYTKGYRVVQYLVVFPLSQLVPVLNWLAEQAFPSTISASEYAQWDMFGGGREFSTGITAEEVGAMAGASKVMERLDVALARHFRSHALFYVESVVEAIPQAIVQMLAVSFLNEASPLQVFSLALSMVSIISKGYVLSRAFGIPEMAYKFFVGAFDVFSLFYAVATLISSTSSKDIHIGGSVFVDYLSFAWLLKIGAVWLYITIIASSLGIFTLIHSTWSDWNRNNVLKVSAFFGVGLLGVIPVVILAEGSKLIWVNLLLSIVEPSKEMFPKMAMWYSFTNRGESWRERGERLRYVCLRFLDDTYSVEAVMAQRQRQKQEALRRGMHRRLNTAHHVTVGASSPILPETTSVTFSGSDHHQLRKLDMDKMPHSVKKALPALQAKHFSVWRLIFDTQFSDFEFKLPDGCIERFVVISAGIGVSLFSLGQVFSLIFPFVHYIVFHGHQNLLQDYCFYGTAASFAIVLLLTPFPVRYLAFNWAVMFIAKLHPPMLRKSDKLEKYVEDYFLPPHQLFISNEIDPALLPSDLVHVVASYLRREDLDLRDVTAEHCRLLKEQLVDEYKQFECSHVKEEEEGEHQEEEEQHIQ